MTPRLDGKEREMSGFGSRRRLVPRSSTTTPKPRPSPPSGAAAPEPSASWRYSVISRTKLIALAAALGLAMSIPVAVPRASGEEARPALGETRVFTRVPYPGGGGGFVVDGDTVWTTTLAFMDPEVDRWPVWAYDRRNGREKADLTFSIARPGPAVMALRGMARDAQGRLYLVDMNGRVLRTTGPSPDISPALEVYGTIPSHGNGAASIPWAGGS